MYMYYIGAYVNIYVIFLNDIIPINVNWRKHVNVAVSIPIIYINTYYKYILS